MVKVVCLLVLVCLILASSVFAKDLYVSTSGNDGVSYVNNNINNPWNTVEKGWNSAKAGDTVYFRSGTYTVDKPIKACTDGNEGTSDNKIIYTNYQEEEIIIDGDGMETIIYASQNYIIIEGMNFRNAENAFEIGDNDVCSTGRDYKGIIIRDNTWTTSLGGDNRGFVIAIGPDRVTDITIQGNVLTCNNCGGVHQNTAGIEVGKNDKFKILNNEIHGFPVGIYHKYENPGNAQDIEIAYNYITGSTRWSMDINTNGAYIHDNIMGADNKEFRICEDSGMPGGNNNRF